MSRNVSNLKRLFFNIVTEHIIIIIICSSIIIIIKYL